MSAVEPVYLRPLDMSDLDQTLVWHNTPELYSTLVGGFRFVSMEAETEWLRQRVGYSSNAVALAICLAETSQHIGNAYIDDIDWANRIDTFGIFIGESGLRGRGYGCSATKQVLKHAFSDLGLRKISVSALADNPRVLRMNEKCGFIHEGCLRKHVFKAGRFVDLVLMAVFAEGLQQTATGGT